MTTKTDGGDRELLELAAKAAGYKLHWHDRWQCFAHVEPFNIHNPPTLAGQRVVWAPLDDDGDALRLAVKLGITIYPPDSPGDDPTTTWAHPDSEWIVEPHGNDPYGATRRAIVRAAAEIERNKS